MTMQHVRQRKLREMMKIFNYPRKRKVDKALSMPQFPCKSHELIECDFSLNVKSRKNKTPNPAN